MPNKPPLNHEERMALICRPITFRIFPRKIWGGVNVGNAGAVPTEGHRTWQLSAEDESYLRYGKADNEGSSD